VASGSREGDTRLREVREHGLARPADGRPGEEMTAVGHAMRMRAPLAAIAP
jgi:hypothetical protein